MKRFGFAVPAVFGLMLAMGSSALADDIFLLTVPENGCTTLCAPAGAVQVDVNLTGTGAGSSTATVTFTGETVGGNLYGLYEVLFQVNGGFGLDHYIVTGGSAAGTVSNHVITPGSLDLYGTFSEESEVVHDASAVEFFLTGGTWTTAFNVLATTPLANSNAGNYPNPFEAAAQVRISTCTSTSQPGCTADDVRSHSDGSLMDTAGPTVPEPTSVILFGSVALLVGGALRRKIART